MGVFRFARPRVRSGSADPLDFPLERDPGGLVDAPAHFFGEAFNIGCRGAAGIDQEIGMLVRARIGWVASRVARISISRFAISVRSPGIPRNRASIKIHPGSIPQWR